jgi:hypothetical protein
MSLAVHSGPAVGTPAAAPDAVRTQARDIFAHIVGIESSIGKRKVPLVAQYLAKAFKAGGFPAADIHDIAGAGRSEGRSAAGL